MQQISICVPVRDFVTAPFSYSLANLTAHCARQDMRIQLNMLMGSEVAMQREQLADQALASGCTHILWLDSDMQFPPNILDKLLSHDRDIVAVNYSTRVEPCKPVAFKCNDDLNNRVTNTHGIEEVSAVGMGGMLVKRKVYEDMDKPYFSVEWSEGYENLIGEDMYFCNKAVYYDYSIWVDNELSQDITHVGTKWYSLKDVSHD
jgi:hypothetical protein